MSRVYLRSIGNKYSARRTEYNGIWYDSKKEADFAKELDILRKATNPRERVVYFKHNYTFTLMNGMNIVLYKCDFKVEYADGAVRYFEVKGKETAVSKIKHKMLRYFYPQIKIEFIR